MAIESVKFRLSTPDDAHLDTYDNTKLTAFNTCPTWGVLRYQMHKSMGKGRVLPLECGSVMHEAFAWVRLCTLVDQYRGSAHDPVAISRLHGLRLFGVERYEEIIAQIPEGTTDRLDYAKIGCIAVIESSGYYDDPSDKRRTLTNMNESILAYCDRWKWERVWCRDDNDPLGDVGIEIPFDIHCTLVADNNEAVEFRLTGKIDGIHWHRDRITLHENKTAARLNDAWEQSFATASQVTGYCIAGSVFTEAAVRHCDVLGLSIPLPKNYDFGGYTRVPVTRKDFHINRWINWLWETVQGFDRYRNNPFDALKFTHSCNRYFRPCSFIPFCDSDDEDQRTIVADMEQDEWSPLHEVKET